MLLAQDSEPALISRIAPRRGASIPVFRFHVLNLVLLDPRYAITVDNRLARVEDAVQRLIPVADAFENWSRTNDQKLPWVNRSFTHVLM